MKQGRPKLNVKKKIEEKKFDLKKIKVLAMHGLTDVELAEMLGIDERTLNRWKKDESFMSVLKAGKQEADAKVEKSLYARACGYEHPETWVGQYQGQVITQELVKHYPPDATSMIFWLKNRQPAKWRDKQEIEMTKPLEVIISDYTGKKSE